ncbi:hypothetical protein DESPIG_00315 [Desulfovibrio piger ATCC 29098]|uniref:Uncharacterized protein n=1 Tax=Desulfovibrio piger ATCC 29098 TaxID=411464 RepID=B6WQJ1_9BACT|nr:hypothetical protein DESPIG_00315 [Desulfovibrio piger ATCC 29098]
MREKGRFGKKAPLSLCPSKPFFGAGCRSSWPACEDEAISILPTSGRV